MKTYKLSLAVNAENEVAAMKIIDKHGLKVSDKLSLRSIDKRAGLIILEPEVEKEVLTDSFYESLLKDNNIVTISDELSVERSSEIIKIAQNVENQLKKLLMYVLPDIAEVLDVMLGVPFEKRTKIEWSKEIQRLTLGGTIKNLEVDISHLTRQKLTSNDNLLTLISSSKDFEDFKESVNKVVEPKTVWSYIEALLEKPVPLSHIKNKLDELCKLRNMAAHPQVITARDIARAKDCQAHLMRYIGATKSEFQASIQKRLSELSASVKPLIEFINKEYGQAFNSGFQDKFKPILDAVATSNASTKPAFDKINLQAIDWTNVLPQISGYDEIMKELTKKGTETLLEQYLQETDELKTELGDELHK